jgi:nicotinate-nucleotide--dimethylbenzimidazole phosphoribosyltransferase
MPLIHNCEDLRGLLAALPGPDKVTLAAAQAREPLLTKPAGALGRLEEIAAFLASWQGRHPARVGKPVARVFAGNHGYAGLGCSAFPPAVTEQMVLNFREGGAAVNQLCATFGAELDVVALDLDRPTANPTLGPAMTAIEFVAAFNAGADAVPDSADILCLGEMGIGNTSAAAAICLGLYGGGAEAWVGPGTGVAGEALRHKARMVADAVDANRSDDPLSWAWSVGGRELAAMAGAMVAARLKRVPVLLDGFVCCAAMAPFAVIAPGMLDHCLVAHVSAEPGHRRLIEKLDKVALLDLGMRLGEASGAVLALGIVKAAAACHAGMATFKEAGVSEG